MDRVMNGQKTYGYMRESTREQNEEQQRIVLLEMGVQEKQIYTVAHFWKLTKKIIEDMQ